MLATYRYYVIVAVIGFVLGSATVLLLFRSRRERKNLVDVIEWAMIEKTVSQLNSMTTIMNRLIADMKSCAEQLTERIGLAQDLEPSIERPVEKSEKE